MSDLCLLLLLLAPAASALVREFVPGSACGTQNPVSVFSGAPGDGDLTGCSMHVYGGHKEIENVDGGWSGWLSWGQCSLTCGGPGGQRSRVRRCDDPARSGVGDDCQGDKRETEACDLGASCPAVDGGRGQWDAWSTCSATCGTGGTRSRQRRCDAPEPSDGGADCLPSDGATESEACSAVASCAVDGGWGQWGSWGGCSSTCGPGSETRTRSCDSPMPSGGGLQCQSDQDGGGGGGTEQRQCNLGDCDGGWSEWGEWSACSASCDGGCRERTRLCDDPAPTGDGQPCSGEENQEENCNGTPCDCLMDGVYYTGVALVTTLTGVLDSDTCRRACLHRYQCGYFTFVETATNSGEADGDCYLYSSVGSTAAQEGVVSGQKSCVKCLEFATDHSGNDHDSYTNIRDAEDCQLLCREAGPENCAVFGYSTDENAVVEVRRTCYLKSARSAAPDTTNTAIISGPPYCNACGGGDGAGRK